MVKETNLSVNNAVIEIDGFVKDYIEHVVGAVLATLRGTGPIENLELTIDKDKQVAINLNNAQVPLGPFPSEIIGNTIKGMVSTLKGVSEIVTLSITLNE